MRTVGLAIEHNRGRRSEVGATEYSGSGIRVGGVSGRDRSHANLGDSSLSSTTTILDSGPTGLRGGSPAGLRGRSNRFEGGGGITRPARQVSQITRPVGLLAPCSTRTQPATWRAARALRTVCWQQPRSSASRRLDGQQESLARAYSSKAAASTIAVRFPLSRGSLRSPCGRAANGRDWVLAPGSWGGTHRIPVRSAGPRPVWSTGLSGSSRLLPPFPGVDPGLELGGGIGEHGPQHGEAVGLLLVRRRAEAPRRGSVGRIFGDGIGPALALGQGWVRIISRSPLPIEMGFGLPRPDSLVAFGLGIKGIK